MATAKPKIGLVLDTSLDSTDGVPQYVISLGSWLQSKGHEVHYLVGESQRQDVPNVHSLAKNIAVNFNGNRTTVPLFASRRRIKRFMAEQQFDVLHVQTPHHPFLAQRLVMAASSQTAIVGTFHILPYGPLAKIGSKLLGIWLRPSLKRFDKMIAVSAAAAEFCEHSYGIKPSVIPNMVDYAHYHDALPFTKYDDKTITILFLGRLVERKGCQVLLNAVAKLAKSDLPKFRLLICGSGHLEKQLKKFVDDNNLSKIVEFAGFVSEADKPRYYASADIAVFPSIAGESFGIVLIEAMSSGRSVVLAGNNPGYASVMTSQPDLLFEPKDVDELCRKLQHFIIDGAARQQMAAWAGNYAQDFDINVVGQKILNLYQDLLRKRRSL